MSIQSTKIQAPTLAGTTRAWHRWAKQLCTGSKLRYMEIQVRCCPFWRIIRLYRLMQLEDSARVMLHVHRNPTWDPRKEAYDA